MLKQKKSIELKNNLYFCIFNSRSKTDLHYEQFKICEYYHNKRLSNVSNMRNIKNTTQPGINYNSNYNLLNKDEKSIIEHLSKKYWLATRFDHKTVGGSTYKTAFIKPTEQVSEGFNLHREIVVIFSDYDKFMPRCLDVIDMFDIQELRLEEICCVIISKDENVNDRINDYLKSQKESRVLIPFTYAELLNNPDDEFVLNRFRSQFYQRDLFDLQDPLRSDLYFFGRGQLVHELVNKHLSFNNAGIFGLRKTGKTSILFGVERTLVKKESISLFIDCQTLHQLDWRPALHHIIFELAKKCNIGRKRIHSNEDYMNPEKFVPDLFQEDIRYIYNQNNGKSILLIFDEIEHITFDTSVSEPWKSGEAFVKFWQVIRSAYQTLHDASIFSYLIAGTNPHCVEQMRIGSVDNPVFQQFNPIFIPPFDLGHTQEMVEKLGGYMGLIFAPEIYTHLNEDFGGHPLLIRQMCSFMHRKVGTSRPYKIDKSFYDKTKKEFYENSSGFTNYAQMILGVLENDYKDEYTMLEYLAMGDVQTFNGLAEVDRTYISHLLSYGIITKNEANDGYTFRIEAIKDYLIQKTKYKRLYLSEDEKWAEISERRNKLEPKLRDIVRIQLKSGCGESEATRRIITKLISSESSNKDKINRLNSPVYKDYFNPEKVNIYFKTLIDVIIANYEDCFRNLIGVDVETFKNRVELLNKFGRVDAHAKHIDDNEFQRFRVDIEWIEGIIEENS